MTIVAISQRVDSYPDRNEIRDALDQQLCLFLSETGTIPVPVPNRLVDVTVWLGRVQPQAIVLSGGNDIGDFPARDQTETTLLEYAALESIPVLGICRGMQMMALHCGGALKPVTGHVRTVHELTGEITGPANSYHNYSVEYCPDGFKVLANSEDGEIEAFGHLERPWEGWMWHPEREAVFSSRDINRIQSLFR